MRDPAVLPSVFITRTKSLNGNQNSLPKLTTRLETTYQDPRMARRNTTDITQSPRANYSEVKHEETPSIMSRESSMKPSSIASMSDDSNVSPDIAYQRQNFHDKVIM